MELNDVRSNNEPTNSIEFKLFRERFKDQMKWKTNVSTKTMDFSWTQKMDSLQWK